MMIGQSGRYLEIRRADEPLRQVSIRSILILDGCFGSCQRTYVVVRTRIAPALSSWLALTAD